MRNDDRQKYALRQAPGRARALALFLCAAAWGALDAEELPPATDNQVPNFDFRGTFGASFGNITGEVPTLWRAVTVGAGGSAGSGAITLETVPLAADTLFPGSPPTNAIRFTVDAFGTPPAEDQVFDHSPNFFSVLGGRDYFGAVYLRADNGDASGQAIDVAFPLFDTEGNFFGAQPGSFRAQASAEWQQFTGPVFSTAEAGLAHLAFRMVNDGGDDSILIALPEVTAQPLANRVPNPAFAGGGGPIQGRVEGTVPDSWRAFAIEGGELSVELVPLAANVLFDGSPAVNAVELTLENSAGFHGFDHEILPFLLDPSGLTGVPAIYARSANGDGSTQGINLFGPVFDDNGFTGRTILSQSLPLSGDWNLIAGAPVTEAPGTRANLAVSLVEDGGENRVLIALPSFLALRDAVFADSFEVED